MYRSTIVVAFILLSSQLGVSQEEKVKKKESPPFKLFRAEESYNYLKDKENNPYEKDHLDAIKFIPLNKTKNINLSFGGQIRPRVEYFSNRGWSEEDENFYSQRLSLHTNLNISSHVRVFGEMYHGFVSLEEREFANSDDLDWHQGFVEIKLPFTDKSDSKFRFGRQEMAFGATRLLGLREGPNIRRSYDMARAMLHRKNNRIDLFYGKEVTPGFGVFDNKSNLFDSNANNPALWGLYSQFKIKNISGKNELYYLGFDSPSSAYTDAGGDDKRHTFGLRRFGKIGAAWKYNTELIGQLGKTGGKSVTAWAFETDWYYAFNSMKLQPELGLKLDVISGDKKNGDADLQTFNPLFPNPAYFSLAATIAPVNLIEFHPSFSFKPRPKMKIYTEWASFYRYSAADGVYAPPRFLKRKGQQTDERSIGNQFGLKYNYEINRHLCFDFDLSYFLAGKFLEETGEAENIFHFASTVSYQF